MMMVRPRIYLDNNASAPARPAALAAMVEALSIVGNPSSVHAEGRTARSLVENAREEVAAFVGTAAKSVIFTSGGTEAANLALTPRFEIGHAQGCDLLLVGATEHVCVLGGHRFAPEHVRRIDVTPHGLLDLEALARTLAAERGRRVMLALQLANNETGVIQPVADAATLVHAHGGGVVCDAVQAAGKLDIDLAALGTDALLLSAHKFGGPKGVGAVVLAPEAHIGERLLRGGGQERGARAGTENVAAIAGFGAACTAARNDPDAAERMRGLRDALDAAIHERAPDAHIFGAGAPRLPNTIAFAIPGTSAETLLIGLDLEGVAVSSGSACSSGKVVRSHVLEAMGVPNDLARGAIRLSLGWASTAADVHGFAEALATVLRKMEGRKRAAA